jgi:hypothetical protein
MVGRSILQHPVKAAQSLYHETQIIVEREGKKMGNNL